MIQTDCSGSLELNSLYSLVHLQFRWTMVGILILTSTVTWWTTKNLITVFRDIQSNVLALRLLTTKSFRTKTEASRVVYDKNPFFDQDTVLPTLSECFIPKFVWEKSLTKNITQASIMFRGVDNMLFFIYKDVFSSKQHSHCFFFSR